jgi:hypothetical protein
LSLEVAVAEMIIQVEEEQVVIEALFQVAHK